jgi:hypothetical protein
MCGNLRETNWNAILTGWAKGKSKEEVKKFMKDPYQIANAKRAAEENLDYNNDDHNWYER